MKNKTRASDSKQHCIIHKDSEFRNSPFTLSNSYQGQEYIVAHIKLQVSTDYLHVSIVHLYVSIVHLYVSIVHL